MRGPTTGACKVGDIVGYAILGLYVRARSPIVVGMVGSGSVYSQACIEVRRANASFANAGKNIVGRREMRLATDALSCRLHNEHRHLEVQPEASGYTSVVHG